ncbi:hypothetical protein MARBORIA2_17890 [Methanobrevibacter arboriphilus]|jgi:hypothetical protein|uniref:Uncharacterized protein n=1 Tax=Methanobrevibacter arboriphilus TaxID=39441 RepID=A0ACA8R5G6_METAZ|nr:ATP-binding protein [Methanobrevibacter arboriphilus]BBL62620.1 hypothetical protein MarbSA_16600 [Methanobrevibacter arboriphilus]GLI12699.1 hypothetical protein MARBORIA2_17890 [Methanobrevibacter arboriphilus]
MLFHKKIDEISEKDINNIVGNEVFEDKYLEYKSEYNHSDKIKFKLIKTVCGFANSDGGLLIYGITEDENHTPSEVTGVKLDSSFDNEVNWIESIVSSNSEPSISNIEIRQIEIKESDRIILIIKVPKSWNLPHRVVQGKPNKKSESKREFFVRRQSKTVPLEIDELKNLFSFAGDVHDKIHLFRDNQIAKVVSDNVFICTDSQIALLIDLIPFNSFNNVEFDIRETKDQVPTFGQGDSRYGEYNFEGVISKSMIHYSQIYRNGIIEGLVSSNRFLKVPLKEFFEYTLNFINDSIKLYEKINFSPPFAIFISLINIENRNLETLFFDKEAISDRNVLPGHEIMIEKYLSKNEIAFKLKTVFDSFYNHFGIENSPFYDEEGNWKKK